MVTSGTFHFRKTIPHSNKLAAMDTNETERTVSEPLSSEGLQAKLSSLHHSMNNPLAVISGNVQLLQELAGALSVVDDMGGPLKDIESAVDQLGADLDQLILLRELLKQI
jgi:signal transduction histidine kinase